MKEGRLPEDKESVTGTTEGSHVVNITMMSPDWTEKYTQIQLMVKMRNGKKGNRQKRRATLPSHRSLWDEGMSR